MTDADIVRDALDWLPAADAFERIVRERDTLREALERIAGLPNLLANSSVADALDIARAALAAVSPPQEGEA